MAKQLHPPVTTIETTDGITTVTDVKEIDFTSGAVVTDGGNGSAQVAISGTTDEQAKVSANDTTTDFLLNKIVAGTNITINELNDGGNETLEVVAAGGADEQAKVSANDTTTDYLVAKVVGSSNITATETNDGGNETLVLDVPNTATVRIQELITSETLGSDGGFTQITVPGSPLYDVIYAEFLVRSDNADNKDDMEIALNGDTSSANYNTQQFGVDELSAVNGFSGTQNDIADIVADTGPNAAEFSFVRVWIKGHTTTTYYTQMYAISGNFAGDDFRWRSLQWQNTAVVTTIDFTPESGTNFKQNSSIKVYGFRDATVHLT